VEEAPDGEAEQGDDEGGLRDDDGDGSQHFVFLSGFLGFSLPSVTIIYHIKAGLSSTFFIFSLHQSAQIIDCGNPIFCVKFLLFFS